MENIWEIAPRKFDEIIDQLLYNRGVIKSEKDKKAKEKFFQPDFEKDLFDPFLMNNIKEAVCRLQLAVSRKETVGIFADYDADGIPGAALLYKALTKIGLKVIIYIPNRENGYGLSEDGIDYLISEKCSLIITVDLGIRNFKEAVYCKEKKIDLIITDHHTPDDKIPDGFLVINPKISGDKYPYKELCGCGVAFKLVQALSKDFVCINESFLKWNLDLVAISTISDVVPLNGENRVLAKYGLKVLNKTKNLGLSELIKIAGIKPGSINGYVTGFKIGPRINAPGRIDHATRSLELLVTEDKKEATELAMWLNEKNESRQVAMERVEKEATKKIIDSSLYENSIIILSGDWPKGVIGPTASRIADKYFRPTILFSEDKDGFVGSARSVGDINILEIIEKVEKDILRYGGHKGAAGLTVAKEKFRSFCENIIKYSNKDIPKEGLVKKIRVDAEVEISELTLGLCESIKKLEPFGMGNPRPTFLIRGAELEYLRFVGKENKHFSCHIRKGNHAVKSIYFNFEKNNDSFDKEQLYDLIFNTEVDEWSGEQKVNLNISDMRESLASE